MKWFLQAIWALLQLHEVWLEREWYRWMLRREIRRRELLRRQR